MTRKKFIERKRVGRKFAYYLDDKEVKDKELLEYLGSFRIPPAWGQVQISVNRNDKILATGYDKAGRLQYIYHPKFRAKQEREKFERILKFARALPKMRKATQEHLSQPGLHRDKVLALVVRLMDEAYFRVGGEEYAKDNQHYGISTLRSKHISISGDTVNFDFVGKSGQRQTQKLTNRRMANIIKMLDELPGYEVFKYFDDEGNLTRIKSSDVNEYIKEVMGDEFSAKDFRTWGGTLLATAGLSEAEWAESEGERKKIVAATVAKVARRLGNTPAIARSSYIDPRVISSFVDNNDLQKVKLTVRDVGSSSYLSHEERCVLKLLEQNT